MQSMNYLYIISTFKKVCCSVWCFERIILGEVCVCLKFSMKLHLKFSCQQLLEDHTKTLTLEYGDARFLIKSPI